MTDHEHFLELGAASIDFDLSRSEAAELASHLHACSSCTGAIDAMHADARAIATMPTRTMAPPRASAALSAAVGNPFAVPLLRIVLVAGALVLLALAVLTGPRARFVVIPRVDSVLVIGGEDAQVAPVTTVEVFGQMPAGQ